MGKSRQGAEQALLSAILHSQSFPNKSETTTSQVPIIKE